MIRKFPGSYPGILKSAIAYRDTKSARPGVRKFLQIYETPQVACRVEEKVNTVGVSLGMICFTHVIYEH